MNALPRLKNPAAESMRPKLSAASAYCPERYCATPFQAGSVKVSAATGNSRAS
jgi:hypothetical protein